MHRSFTTIIVTLLLTALVANAFGQDDATPERPNILFFLVDDQRNDTLGCAGHPIVRTPTVDQLAAEGVMFDNMFVSTSICWVSRTNILTGMSARTYSEATRGGKLHEPALSTIYPTLIREAGYRTGYMGKWHTKLPTGNKPEELFDDFRSIFRRPYFKEQPDGTLRHTTELIADAGVDFLESQSDDEPFCLSLNFNASHAEDGDKRPGVGHFPWPKAVDGMYDDIEMPVPRLSDPAIYESQPQFLKDSINRERYFWRWDTPEKYETNMRAYFRMLTGIDGAMARVLETLEGQGLAENTIVVYSADNGYYMGDRGFAGKWSHYEQSLRVPLIIYDPRLPESERGRVESPMVMNIDLPATFLEWAGVEIPDVYQGRSFAQVAAGEETPSDWRTEFFCEHVDLAPYITWEGVRTERYIYARYFDQQPVYEFLHDLETDPDELVNLVPDPDYADVLDDLRERCDGWVEQYGGPLPELGE
jgi:arylsulfatase A-like enzyme